MALTAPELTKYDDLLLIQFQTLELPFLHSVFSYWPIEENNEPDTHLFTAYLRFRNPELRIAYPVSNFETMNMEARLTDIDTPFEKANLNIFEPTQGEPLLPNEIDMVFVPLLAFDKNGFRVGYGKGFYDKYLKTCRDDCIKVGFSYFEALEEEIDKSDFDVPLDFCITPQTVYVF